MGGLKRSPLRRRREHDSERSPAYPGTPVLTATVEVVRKRSGAARNETNTPMPAINVNTIATVVA